MQPVLIRYQNNVPLLSCTDVMDPFWVVVIRSWHVGRGDKQPPLGCTSQMEDGEKQEPM